MAAEVLLEHSMLIKSHYKQYNTKKLIIIERV